MKSQFKFFHIIVVVIMMTIGCFSLAAQTVSKEYQDTVSEFMTVTNAKETLKTTLVQTYSSMNLPVSNIEGMTNDILDTMWPDYIADTAKVMSEFYTLGDLNEMIKFYKTPVGKKFAKNSPLVAEKTSKILMQNSYINMIQNVILKYMNK